MVGFCGPVDGGSNWPDCTGGLLLSTRLQRLPLIPIEEVHFRSGRKRMDAMLDPLIFALPHSVSTETVFRSVAPVTESPFLKITVVDVSSADANFTPAISE